MLTNISISGEVYCEYAYLAYDMCFENASQRSALAEYIFSLPENAVISDMKIIRSDKSIVKTTVVSVSHGARMWETSASGSVLSKIDDRTYMLRFGAVDRGECHIRLRVYVSMPQRNGERVLTIPIAKEGSGEGRCKRCAQVSLVLRGDFENALKYSSPTHRLSEETLGREIEVSTGEIRADRDFCLRISGRDSENSAIVTRGKIGGSMLCRLYPHREFFESTQRDYKQLLLIYDGTGALLRGASGAGRELLLEMVKAFCGRFMVIAAGEKARVLTDGFCEYNEENLGCLTREISNDLYSGGSLLSALEYAKDFITNETLPVVITGTKNSQLQENYENIFAGSGFCAVTLGAMAEAAYLDEFVRNCGGAREHIFGNDNIEQRAAEILQSFRSITSPSVEAYVDGERAAVINEGDCRDCSVTVFAEFFGDTVPHRILLKSEDAEETIILKNISVYQSFAPVQFAYAGYVSAHLQKRLDVCPACEVQKLRSQLEEIGIKYSYINSETALVAMFEGTKTEVIRTVVPPSGCRQSDVFEGRASVFGEVDSGISDDFAALCTDIIIRSMRADGAICASGEVNPEIRRQQTLVCVLALIAAGMREEYLEFIAIGRKYLGEFSYGELKSTESSALANEMLGKIFGDKKPLPYGFMPDLLTAARMIAQNHHK